MAQGSEGKRSQHHITMALSILSHFVWFFQLLELIFCIYTYKHINFFRILISKIGPSLMLLCSGLVLAAYLIICLWIIHIHIIYFYINMVNLLSFYLYLTNIDNSYTLYCLFWIWKWNIINITWKKLAANKCEKSMKKIIFEISKFVISEEAQILTFPSPHLLHKFNK